MDTKKDHFPGHQQALIKNNICVAVLSFSEHDADMFNAYFTKQSYDYDDVVDLCQIQKDAYIGSAWDGTNFNIHVFPSWTLGQDNNWHPPVEKPVDDKFYYWDEDALSWVEHNPQETIN